jgi:hypothetical protein
VRLEAPEHDGLQAIAETVSAHADIIWKRSPSTLTPARTIGHLQAQRQPVHARVQGVHDRGE